MLIKGNQIVEGSITVGKRLNEGFTEILLNSSSFSIPNVIEKFIRFTTNLSSTSVLLPDATSIPVGSEYIIYTTSEGITIADNTGDPLQLLNSGSVYYIYLASNSSVAGQWVISTDTSFDISVGSTDTPNKGVRSYFKIKIHKEFTAILYPLPLLIM